MCLFSIWIVYRSDFTVVFIVTVDICTFACPKVPKDLKGEPPLDNPLERGSSDKCQLSCRTVAQLASAVVFLGDCGTIDTFVGWVSFRLFSAKALRRLLFGIKFLWVCSGIWIVYRSDFTVVFIVTVDICTFACPKVPKDLKEENPP